MPLSKEQFYALQWGDTFVGSPELRNIKVVAVSGEGGDFQVAVQRWYDKEHTWLKWNSSDGLAILSGDFALLQPFLEGDVRIVPEDVDLALDRLEKEEVIPPNILERLRKASRVSVENGIAIMDTPL